MTTKALTESLKCFSICPITCRDRGWPSELASHWLPGRQWQPVARTDVFWQAEERLVVSDQSPAQHIQTAIPPHKGSSRERAVNIIRGNKGCSGWAATFKRKFFLAVTESNFRFCFFLLRSRWRQNLSVEHNLRLMLMLLCVCWMWTVKQSRPRRPG